jgi:hypothetical protein
MPARDRRPSSLVPFRGLAPAGGSPAIPGAGGTAVVMACSLMGHAPACPPAGTGHTRAAERHDSITGGNSLLEQALSTVRGGGHPPEGWLMIHERPAAGPEFRPAPATGQNVGQKCAMIP